MPTGKKPFRRHNDLWEVSIVEHCSSLSAAVALGSLCTLTTYRLTFVRDKDGEIKTWSTVIEIHAHNKHTRRPTLLTECGCSYPKGRKWCFFFCTPQLALRALMSVFLWCSMQRVKQALPHLPKWIRRFCGETGLSDLLLRRIWTHGAIGTTFPVLWKLYGVQIPWWCYIYFL